MQISNNFSVSGVGLPSGSSRAVDNVKSAPVETAGSLNPVDQLDFSPEAEAILSADSSSSDIRTDKVASIRQQIAAGTYDTDEKFSAALDKLLESLG